MRDDRSSPGWCPLFSDELSELQHQDGQKVAQISGVGQEARTSLLRDDHVARAGCDLKGRATIYIPENDILADILACCPLTGYVMEQYSGQGFFKRDYLDKISLSSAITMRHLPINSILIELNQICIYGNIGEGEENG